MAAVGEVDGAHAQTPVRYAFSKKGFNDYGVVIYDHQLTLSLESLLSVIVC